VTLLVDTDPTSTPPPSSRELCAASAELARQAAAAAANGPGPRRTLATRTITALAPCRAVSAAAVARILGVGSVETESLYFDSGCDWFTSSGAELSVNMYLFSSGGTTDGTPSIVAGHHLLRLSGTGSGGFCVEASVQGDAPNGTSEAFQFAVSSPSVRAPAATTCGQATQAAVALLNALQLT
jgi:hypothetical protein